MTQTTVLCGYCKGTGVVAETVNGIQVGTRVCPACGGAKVIAIIGENK